MDRKTSVLQELTEAVKAGNTLPWVLRHAPRGDVEKALTVAWKAELQPRVLIDFLDEVLKVPAKLRPRTRSCWTCCDRKLQPKFEVVVLRPLCRGCCRRIRAVTIPPTWTECIEGRQVPLEVLALIA